MKQNLNFLLKLIIEFSFLKYISLAKFDIYPNKIANGLVPNITFTSLDEANCLVVYGRYCSSSIDPNGIKACEIRKLSNGYQCNLYGSSFTANSLSYSATSKVYIKKGIKLNIKIFRILI